MAFFETYIRDLTHARPLHPDTLRYLVQATGFTSVNIEYRALVTEGDRLDRVSTPGGADTAMAAVAAAVNDHADKLNARLFSSMDYAVIARR
jgi:O-antigen chain-terminating methyltransferase